MHTIKLVGGETEQLMGIASALGEEVDTTSRHERARFCHKGNTIIIYNSGKVVFSSFPDSRLAGLISGLFEATDGQDCVIIGSDEAGKGEPLGPLVVSAFALDRRERALARLYGAMDSKELSPQQVSDVYTGIYGFTHSHSVMPPADFNGRFSNNLNELLLEMHLSAIGSLAERVRGPAKVIVDKFGGKLHDEMLKRGIAELFGCAEVEVITKGERHVPVACASIAAKAEYEKWLRSYEEKYGLNLHGRNNLAALFRHPHAREICKLKYIK